MPKKHGAEEGGAASSFAEMVGAGGAEASSGAGDDGGDGAKVDFTHMTRQDMFDWMNEQIQSGAMSFDESSTFVSMTVGGKADGGLPGPDDTQQVDFLQATRAGLDGARQRHDADLYKRLNAALDTMQRSQTPAVGGVRVTA